MGALTEELRDFLDASRVGVLATVAESGRPQQSLVYFAREGERLLISTLAERRKAKDVERSGWASLCVMGQESPYPAAQFTSRNANAIQQSVNRLLKSNHIYRVTQGVYANTAPLFGDLVRRKYPRHRSDL